MPPRKGKGDCKCGVLEQMADEPKCPIKFDAELNEYQIVEEGGGAAMIYFCPFCGGRAPKSRRERLFHRLTNDELRRLLELTKELKTVDDVIRAFGQPDRKHPIGTVVTTPEREGKPERAENFPLFVYTQLSETAEVYVSIYPTGTVAISFQGKCVKQDKR